VPTSNQLLDDVEDEPSLAAAPGRRWVSPAQAAAIAQVDHFRNSEYRTLDLNELIDSYVHNFVEPLLRLKVRPSRVADIGAGYGWLACAFALRTDARVVVMEVDGARLRAAQQIAAILGVSGRMEWITASIAGIPLPDQSVDAAYCVEVIEHTGTDPAFVAELGRITSDVLVITSPNKLFPVIGHDTELPFCHWLPLPLRDVYARACGRSRLQENNLFWTPQRLFRALPAFRRTSAFLQFENYAAYRQERARLGGRAGWTGRCKAVYFTLAACLGRKAVYLMPNLATTFRRIGAVPGATGPDL
jgi:predicted RNA methylase